MISKNARANIFFLTLTAYHLALTTAFAFNWEPPDKFIITIKSLMLKNNTGEWVTVVEPDKEVDLFSDQAKVTFFNQGRIPEGNYINFKLVISEAVKVAEADNFGNKTKAGGVVRVGGTARDNFELPGEITSFVEKSPTWNEREEGDITAVINYDGEDEDDVMEIMKKNDFAQAFQVKKGTFIHVVVAMDLRGTCYQVGAHAFGKGKPRRKAMAVFPPRFVDEVRVTMDQRTELLHAEDVIIRF